MPNTNSIIDYLNSKGQNSSFTSRKKLAEENGMTNYTGTADQNLRLLSVLRKNEGIQPSTDTGATTGSGSTKKEAIKSPSFGPNDTTKFVSPNQYALLRFTNDPDGAEEPASSSTVWLIDQDNQTLRPFLSEQAFNNFFKNAGMDLDLNSALEQGLIYTAPSSLLNKGFVFGDYELMKNEYAIGGDGKYKVKTAINTEDVKKNYGQTFNPQVTNAAYDMIDNFIGVLKNDPTSGISQEVLSDTITATADTLGLYVNALAYGDYSLADIYQDLKRRQLIKDGNEQLAGLKIIDEKKVAGEYQKSGDGSLATNNPLLTVPRWIGEIDMTTLDLPIYKLDPKVYQQLVKPWDWTTPEGKAEAEKIEASYYDVMTQRLEADTEQAKATADYNWQLFRDNIEKAYGIKLSDNSFTAWDQLTALTGASTQAGITGSGISQEIQDRYLADVRRNDQILRDEKMDSKEQEMMNYYKTSASSEQIANDLTPEEREKWGLSPSQDTKNFFNLENLKRMYPNTDEKTLVDYANSILDANGNYRSTLYKTLFDNKYLVRTGQSFSSVPEGGKEGYQTSELIRRKNAEETAAYKTLTQSNDPFAREDASGATVPDAISTTSVNKPGESYYDQPTTTTNSFTPRPGTEYIPNVDSMKNYTDIYKDTTPGSNKLYGTLKNTSSPSVISPEVTTQNVFTPKPGTEYIPNVDSMKNYTNIYKDTTPGSKKLYGTRIK